MRFGARDYDAEIGRWLAKDPIWFFGKQLDIYNYFFSDSRNYDDFTGVAPDINKTGRNDPAWKYDQRYRNKKDIFELSAHGITRSIFNGDKGVQLMPDGVANLIFNHPDYEPGMTVKLLACETAMNPGDGSASFAQRLADILGAPISPSE